MNKSSAWGASNVFLDCAIILFLFAQWSGMPDALMWTARVLALLSLLVGVLGACTEAAKGKK